MNLEIIHKAIKFAEEKHAGQTRKASPIAYVTHPIAVSYIAANFKKSKNLSHLIVAAILHDTIEDTSATFEELVKEFGMFVASLVWELTDNPEQKKAVGKLEYQKTKWPGLSSYGLYLKLCDRLANVSDNPKPEYLVQTKEILNHLEKRRKLSKSQKEVVKEIRKYL